MLIASSSGQIRAVLKARIAIGSVDLFMNIQQFSFSWYDDAFITAFVNAYIISFG